MLPTILEQPSDDLSWERWAWHHYEHHQLIVQAVNARGGSQISLPLLFPMFAVDRAEWLVRHQQAHIDFTGALGIQSVNLEQVEFNDERQLQAWIRSNYQEHNDAAFSLRI